MAFAAAPSSSYSLGSILEKSTFEKLSSGMAVEAEGSASAQS